MSLLIKLAVNTTAITSLGRKATSITEKLNRITKQLPPMGSLPANVEDTRRGMSDLGNKLQHFSDPNIKRLQDRAVAQGRDPFVPAAARYNTSTPVVSKEQVAAEIQRLEASRAAAARKRTTGQLDYQEALRRMQSAPRQPTRFGTAWLDAKDTLRYMFGGKPKLGMLKEAYIKLENGKHYVYSEKGKKLSRGYDSQEEAAKRLREIEYFKHKGKKAALGGLAKTFSRWAKPAAKVTDNVLDAAGGLDGVNMASTAQKAISAAKPIMDYTQAAYGARRAPKRAPFKTSLGPVHYRGQTPFQAALGTAGDLGMSALRAVT